MRPYHIFDFDGTVADSMYVWNQCAGWLLGQYGVTPTPQLLKGCVHLNLQDSARYFVRECGLTVPPERLVEQVEEHIKQEYLTKVPARPGIHRVLRQLNEAGAACCVATGSPGPLIEASAERLGVSAYVRFVQPVWEGAGKHRPDIYLRSLQRLGGTKPEDAVVYEDSLICMRTAAEAGFAVVATPAPEDLAAARELLEQGMVQKVIACWDEYTLFL